jgi:hypothetical protein
MPKYWKFWILYLIHVSAIFFLLLSFLSLFPLSSSLFPLPSSLFPPPSSLFPLPSLPSSLFLLPSSLFPLPSSLFPLPSNFPISSFFLVENLQNFVGPEITFNIMYERDFFRISGILMKNCFEDFPPEFRNHSGNFSSQ